MPYISETEYQNLHHTIIRLSESNEKIKEKLTALKTAAADVADIVQYYIMQNSRISNMLNTDEQKAIAKLEALLGETK